MAHFSPHDITALTLDLDDTLWPVWPAIARAEAAVLDWLAVHAPATAQAFDACGLRALREQVALAQPTRAHDLSAMRRESLRLALTQAGDDPAHAEPAFEVFFAARQRIELFDDARPALERLARRYPLFALTNGNADLVRTGVSGWFRGGLTAAAFGVGKPDPRIFHAACRALGMQPSEVLHVGDDLVLDARAAHDAGLQSAWLRRGVASQDAEEAAPHGTLTVPDLLTLADRLGC